MQVEVIRVGGNKDVILDLAKKRIELKVGITKGATTTDGNNIAEYGFYNEYGTPNIPARPFMRNTRARYEDEWKRTLLKGFQKQFIVLSGRNFLPKNLELRGLFTVLGVTMASQIKKVIQDGHFQANKPATIAAKARKGRIEPDHPLIDTGQMLESISYEVKEYIER